MTGRSGDEDGRSALDGLGATRSGAHRTTGGGAGAFFSSMAAVLAVLVLLGGLYAFFGRDGDDVSRLAGDDTSAPRSSATASPPARPAGTPPPAAPLVDPDADAGSAAPDPSGSTSPLPDASGGASGDAQDDGEQADASERPEDPGAGDEGELRDLQVVVLNQSGVAGLAARTAETLRAAGWDVSSIGNFRGTVPSTTVYYPDGAEAAAQALIESMSGTQRMRPAFPGISTTKLTVILA